MFKDHLKQNSNQINFDNTLGAPLRSSPDSQSFFWGSDSKAAITGKQILSRRWAQRPHVQLRVGALLVAVLTQRGVYRGTYSFPFFLTLALDCDVGFFLLLFLYGLLSGKHQIILVNTR